MRSLNLLMTLEETKSEEERIARAIAIRHAGKMYSDIHWSEYITAAQWVILEIEKNQNGVRESRTDEAVQ